MTVEPGTPTAETDVERYFRKRKEASIAAAKHIATALTRQLNDSPETSLIVTGGSSPAACYQALAATELAWDRIDVLLSDERWVPPTDQDSNERMIRNSLLTGHAAQANLHPFFDDVEDVLQRSVTFTDEFLNIPKPLACCLLGMGEDGHIASLFPDANNFAAGIDVDSEQVCIPITTAVSSLTRISLTLNAMLQSVDIVLLFFGDSKLAVYEQAKRSPTKYPVSRLLHQDRVSVSVFWAP